MIGLGLAMLVSEACSPRTYSVRVTEVSPGSALQRRQAPRARSGESLAQRPSPPTPSPSQSPLSTQPTPVATTGSERQQSEGIGGSFWANEQTDGAVDRTPVGTSADTSSMTAADQGSPASRPPSRWLLSVLVIGLASVFAVIALGRLRS